MTNTARCTHGGDCKVHPDVHALHDFTPTAVDVLRDLQQWAVEHDEYGTQLRIAALAAEHGLVL